MKKGEVMSLKQKKKLSDSLKGHLVSEETRKKISKTKKASKLELTKQHKLNISKGMKKSKKYYLGLKSKTRSLKLRLANLGKKYSKETIKKMSIKRKMWFSNSENKNKTSKKLKQYWSVKANRIKASIAKKQYIQDHPELRKKISIARKGFKLSKESKKKISEKLKGHIGFNKGNKLSQESKNLIGQRSKERWKSKEYYNKVMPKIKKAWKIKWKSKEFVDKMMALKITGNTSIELKIQEFLNELKVGFIPHKYISNIKHSYHCDIFIPKRKLIIEADGNYWHNYPNGNKIDHIRTKELVNKEYKVLRLWESEIKKMTLEDFEVRLNEQF